MNDLDDLDELIIEYTREQFEADRDRLLAHLCAKHGCSRDEVDMLIREHN